MSEASWDYANILFLLKLHPNLATIHASCLQLLPWCLPSNFCIFFISFTLINWKPSVRKIGLFSPIYLFLWLFIYINVGSWTFILFSWLSFHTHLLHIFFQVWWLRAPSVWRLVFQHDAFFSITFLFSVQKYILWSSYNLFYSSIESIISLQI